MAEKCASTPVDCSLVSLPCGFLQLISNCSDVTNDDESLFGLGSNTLLVSENTARTLKFVTQDRCKALWVILKLSLSTGISESDKKNTYESKRLTQILIDRRVSDEFVILSEDFLYNLEFSLGLRDSCHITSVLKHKKLQLECESQYESLPDKATKVILALIQLEITLEDNFIDRVLQSYFSFPRYLCKNDLFGVYIPHHNKLDSISTANINVIYFKVCEVEGNQSHNTDTANNICLGYLVDSSVMIYQVSNKQDLHPTNRIDVSIIQDLDLDELLNNKSLLYSFNSRGHNLTPQCFDDTFQVLCKWMEPFLCGYKKLQDVELSPIFLISGPNGSGKTMLVQALSHYFGINYWRMDCVMLGEPVPGQVEAKLKAVFSKLNSIAPCILHFCNIQVLFEDDDGKDDVRVLTCFEQQIKSLKLKLPVVVMASTSNLKSMSSNISQLFLQSVTVNPPNQAEREDILSWFIGCRGVIDRQILQAVGAQTSGFLLRDLEMLVLLAFMEKFNRTKEENSAGDFVFSDFSKIIGYIEDKSSNCKETKTLNPDNHQDLICHPDIPEIFIWIIPDLMKLITTGEGVLEDLFGVVLCHQTVGLQTIQRGTWRRQSMLCLV